MQVDPEYVAHFRPFDLASLYDNARTPYRPKNVLVFLTCQEDLDGYLSDIGISGLAEHPLPEDVVRRIKTLKPLCSRHRTER